MGVNIMNPSVKTVNIFFATSSGNAKAVAITLQKKLKQNGLRVKFKSILKIDVDTLYSMSALGQYNIFVSSTFGEGQLPDMAQNFYTSLLESIEGNKNIFYSIVGLGDKSYSKFCNSVDVLGDEFERLNFTKVSPDVKFNVDFNSIMDETFQKIAEDIIIDTKNPNPYEASTLMGDDQDEDEVEDIKDGLGYSSKEPVKFKVKEIINLHDEPSPKETRFISFALPESLSYVAGDSFGVMPPMDEKRNPHQDKNPRLYSVSSSQRAYPNEVHVTVGRLVYKDENGKLVKGLCSNYLNDLKVGDEVDGFIRQNTMFRLPKKDTDIIMISIGTGIAPMRGFLQDRVETDGNGKNWLIFGNEHMTCDFLYQQEWIDAKASDNLHNISLAWSHDQDLLIFVQDRILEEKAEFMKWIENGACIYVCGSAKVYEFIHKALVEIFSEFYNITKEQANDKLIDFLDEGRLQKDVL